MLGEYLPKLFFFELKNLKSQNLIGVCEIPIIFFFENFFYNKNINFSPKVDFQIDKKVYHVGIFFLKQNFLLNDNNINS